MDIFFPLAFLRGSIDQVSGQPRWQSVRRRLNRPPSYGPTFRLCASKQIFLHYDYEAEHRSDHDAG